MKGTGIEAEAAEPGIEAEAKGKGAGIMQTEPYYRWPDNWILNTSDAQWYWVRGHMFGHHEYWRYIRPGRGQQKGWAVWYVFRCMVTIQEGINLKLQYQALLPEGQDPPGDFF